MTIAGEKNIVEPGDLSDRDENRLRLTIASCPRRTSDADLSFFIWFQCSDASAMRGF